MSLENVPVSNLTVKSFKTSGHTTSVFVIATIRPHRKKDEKFVLRAHPQINETFIKKHLQEELAKIGKFHVETEKEGDDGILTLHSLQKTVEVCIYGGFYLAKPSHAFLAQQLALVFPGFTAVPYFGPTINCE